VSQESGLHLPLVLHEGLSAAARSLAQSQRVLEREGKLKPDRLRLRTSEDQAADILAREAVGFWAARQSQDLSWSGASLCGIGAALDYTVNRGFVVALLIGYEGLSAEASHGLAERREELAGLRKRQAPARPMWAFLCRGACQLAKARECGLWMLPLPMRCSIESERTSVLLRRPRKLRYDLHSPHAHYTTRRGGYGQVFKNMFGTMLLGLIATEQREDAMYALKNELPEVFWDYRDKYVPKPRSFFGRKPPPKKSRQYPNEDVVYTQEELDEEEEIMEKRELRALKAEMQLDSQEASLWLKVCLSFAKINAFRAMLMFRFPWALMGLCTVVTAVRQVINVTNANAAVDLRETSAKHWWFCYCGNKGGKKGEKGFYDLQRYCEHDCPRQCPGGYGGCWWEPEIEKSTLPESVALPILPDFTDTGIVCGCWRFPAVHSEAGKRDTVLRGPQNSPGLASRLFTLASAKMHEEGIATSEDNEGGKKLTVNQMVELEKGPALTPKDLANFAALFEQ
ncbi:unnamed protein product, partial [Symbiodinium microadriaticum]